LLPRAVKETPSLLPHRRGSPDRRRSRSPVHTKRHRRISGETPIEGGLRPATERGASRGGSCFRRACHCWTGLFDYLPARSIHSPSHRGGRDLERTALHTIQRLPAVARFPNMPPPSTTSGCRRVAAQTAAHPEVTADRRDGRRLRRRRPQGSIPARKMKSFLRLLAYLPDPRLHQALYKSC